MTRRAQLQQTGAAVAVGALLAVAVAITLYRAGGSLWVTTPAGGAIGVAASMAVRTGRV